MMKDCTIRSARMRSFLTLLAVVSGTFSFAQQQAAAGPASQESFEFQIPSAPQSTELKKRTAVLENNVVSQVRLGDRFMKQNEYEAACRAYDRALSSIEMSSLGKSDYIRSVLSKIRSRLDRARKEWGLALFSSAKKEYLAALVEKNGEVALMKIRAAKERAEQSLAPYYAGKDYKSISPSMYAPAIAKDPSFRDNVQAFQKDCSRMEAAYQFKAASSLEAVDPDYNRRQSEIRYLLQQSRIYYKTKQFDKLRASVEKVLVADPYNQEAVRLLGQAYKKLYQIGAARTENDAIAQMAETEWKWVEAVPPEDEQEDVVVRKSSGKQTALYNKLQSIVIPYISFRDGSVETILDYLKSQSKLYDPAKTGVNILKPNKLEERTKKIPYFVLEQVPLLDVIRYVCDIANLSYKVDDVAVWVGLQNSDNDNMEHESFTVSPSLMHRIFLERDPEASKTAKEDDKKDETITDGGEAFTDNTLGASRKDKPAVSFKLPTPQMTMEYFKELGVAFPEGSTVDYDSRSEKIRVKNTRENLRKLEARLQDLDIPQPLVLIDARLMEISMNAMEELGFDWLLTYTNSTTDQSVSFNGFAPDGGSTQTLLSSSQFYRSSGSNYIVNNLKLLPNFGPDNALDLSVSIRALDQMDRTETIATPRLLVSSGMMGKLDVNEQRFFPEDWSEAEVEIINGTSYSYNAPVPEFGDGTPVGTTFTVTPLVSANNHTIILDINTDVSRFTGWSNYDYSIIIGAMFNSSADTSSTNLTPKMKMPEFSRRSIKSKVKLFDGETVVIGGILEDIASKTEDKWPLLGDIPLLGRLFTNYSSSSVKVNMMLFVTARLMRGNGLPLRDSRKRGIFEFNDR